MHIYTWRHADEHVYTVHMRVMSIYLSVCLSVCRSIHLSTYPCIHLSAYLPMCLSMPIYAYLCLSIPICLSMPIYTYLYLSIHPSIHLSFFCLCKNEAILQDFPKIFNGQHQKPSTSARIPGIFELDNLKNEEILWDIINFQSLLTTPKNDAILRDFLQK